MSRAFKFAAIVGWFFFTTATLHAQKAIEVSNQVKRHKQINADVISHIKNMIVVSDTLKGWSVNWVGSLHGSQASYSNWSQGGVNSVSGTASTYFNAQFRKNRFSYALATNLRYGRAHLANEGGRKTDDRIALNNKVSYRFKNGRWNTFGNVNVNTQFDQGFDYSDPSNPKLISSFMSPAYISQVVGIGYVPTDYFTADAGIGLKETIVKNDSLTTLYSLAPGNNFRLEPGYSIRLGFEKNVLKNVKMQSHILTFTNVNRAIRHTDVTFVNEIVGKINSYLNMTFNFEAVYNDNFSKKLQIKEVLSAGLSFTIL